MHFPSSADGPHPYIRAGALIRTLKDFSENSNGPGFGYGGGLGVEFPFAERAACRIEGSCSHYAKADDLPALGVVGFRAGLSLGL